MRSTANKLVVNNNQEPPEPAGTGTYRTGLVDGLKLAARLCRRQGLDSLGTEILALAAEEKHIATPKKVKEPAIRGRNELNSRREVL